MKLRWFAVVSVLLGLMQVQTASAETIQAAVRLKQKVAIEDLAASVTNRSSNRYHKFYTADEIKRLVGPDQTQYDALMQELKSRDLQVTRESPDHLTVWFKGDRKSIESLDRDVTSWYKAFVKTPANQIDHVVGLQASKPRHPMMKFQAQPADFTGYTAAQIKSLYKFNAVYAKGYSGKGQTIAIATYDGFYEQDVKDYYAKNGATPGPTLDTVSFNGTAVFNAGSAAETQTDAEFSGILAPNATIHVFASAENSDAGELAMFTAILADGRAQIVNYSWGMCEKDVTDQHRADMDKVFAQAVAQGVNVFIASGDSGSDCEQDGSVVADFPAVEPYVVAVGGNTMAVDGTTLSETAWSGSGGGISAVYPLPAWQKMLGAMYKFRSYPDVSFNADPNSGQPTWLHYDPGTGAASADAQYVVIGGTSIAAPQWAGFMALVNEAKGQSIGYLNPLLYPLKPQSSCMNDVTSGSNGAYTAVAGWDAVTGWGSMKPLPLLQYLSK